MNSDAGYVQKQSFRVVASVLLIGLKWLRERERESKLLLFGGGFCGALGCPFLFGRSYQAGGPNFLKKKGAKISVKDHPSTLFFT